MGTDAVKILVESEAVVERALYARDMAVLQRIKKDALTLRVLASAMLVCSDPAVPSQAVEAVKRVCLNGDAAPTAWANHVKGSMRATVPRLFELLREQVDLPSLRTTEAALYQTHALSLARSEFSRHAGEDNTTVGFTALQVVQAIRYFVSLYSSKQLDMVVLSRFFVIKAVVILDVFLALRARLHASVWTVDRFRAFEAFRLACSFFLPSLMTHTDPVTEARALSLRANVVRIVVHSLVDWRRTETAFRDHVDALLRATTDLVRPELAALDHPDLVLDGRGGDDDDKQDLESWVAKVSKPSYTVSAPDLDALGKVLQSVRPVTTPKLRSLVGQLQHMLLRQLRSSASPPPPRIVHVLGTLQSIEPNAFSEGTLSADTPYVSTSAFHNEIVKQLLVLLTDADPAVAIAAESTLLSILATAQQPDGAVTDRVTLLSLVFMGARGQVLPLSPEPVPSRDTVWKAPDVLSLVRVFIAVLASSDSFCAHLDKIVVLKPALAKLVFPIAFEQAIIVDGTLRAPAARYLADNWSIEPIESVTLVLLGLARLQRHRYDRKSAPNAAGFNLLVASKAALRCKLPAMALMFAEVHLNEAASTLEQVNPLLVQIYSSIDDPDGLYGVTSLSSFSSMVGKYFFFFLIKVLAQAHRYSHEQQWIHGVQIQDNFLFRANPVETQASVATGLRQLGLLNALSTFLGGIKQQEDPGLRELQYEAAWRNGTWDLDPPSDLLVPGLFQPKIFGALAAVRNNDASLLESVVTAMSEQVLGELWLTGEGDTSKTTSLLNQAIVVTDLESAHHLVSNIRADRDFGLIDKWIARTKQPGMDNWFGDLEQSLLVQNATLRALVSRPEPM